MKIIKTGLSIILPAIISATFITQTQANTCPSTHQGKQFYAAMYDNLVGTNQIFCAYGPLGTSATISHGKGKPTGDNWVSQGTDNLQTCHNVAAGCQYKAL